MGFLSSNFKFMCETVDKSEYSRFPPMYARGKWRSGNTCNEDLQVIANFMRKKRPQTVLECGTFEGRTTEYLFNLMRHNSPPPRKLFTIDVPRNIDHIDLEQWIPEEPEDPLYKEVVRARYCRLELMQLSDEVEVVYMEGLTRTYLERLIRDFSPDFIYQDASHLQQLLEQEWMIAESVPVKSGTVICFDDMKCNDFVGWVTPRLKGKWEAFVNMRERGQLWVEKI